MSTRPKRSSTAGAEGQSSTAGAEGQSSTTGAEGQSSTTGAEGQSSAAKPNPLLPNPLPLFPLRTVLVPGAQLDLKVFEARYLDLVAQCLRSGAPFGVICLRQGAEAGNTDGPIDLEDVGTLAHIVEVDAEQTGILRLHCRAGQRFQRSAAPSQQTNGLWTAPVELLPQDPPRAPGPAVQAAVQALGDAINQLEAQDQQPFAAPHRLDDTGWVANRWCELLPLPLAARQRLMALQDPTLRLSLVDAYLRDKKIIVG